jgi:sulfur-carrier protein
MGSNADVVKILYFARLREDLGCAQEDLVLPEGVDTVAGLRAYLTARGGAWQQALGQRRAYKVAVNQDMAQPGTPVRAGDEVAFFPPVTGG